MEFAVFLRSHIEEIVSLTDEEFILVCSYFKPREVAKKEYLIKSGQTVKSEFLVQHGLLIILWMNDTDRRFFENFERKR